jgi:hypothetical protein
MASIRNVVAGQIDALGYGINSFLGFLMAIPVAVVLHVLLLCLGEEVAPFYEHGNIITINVIYDVEDPLAITTPQH